MGSEMCIRDRFYHLFHALALLVLSTQPSMRRSTFYCFVGGVAVFSGSLYLLCLSGLNWLGAIILTLILSFDLAAAPSESSSS